MHKWHLALVCWRLSSSCIPEYEHMHLLISMLNSIYPLQTKTQNYHLSIPMYYYRTKYQVKFYFHRDILLTINGHET